MDKSFKLVILTISLIFFTQGNLFAQKLLQNGGFRYIPTYDNKAILIKEIALNDVSEAAGNYTRLKNWIKKTYTTDLINSGIMYYELEQSVAVKSRVDLLLPLLNEQNISKKSVMNYNLNAFILNGKCILEISGITYKVENTIPPIKKKVKAEDFVTSDALNIQDQYQDVRIETQKGTLYFFNNLADSLEKTLNQPTKKF